MITDLESMIYALAEYQSGLDLAELSPFFRGPHLRKARAELEAIGIPELLSERETLLAHLRTDVNDR